MLIYIPQGKSAYLQQLDLNVGLTGLYTDGFSVCASIISIGKGEVSLIHCDSQSLTCVSDFQQLMLEIKHIKRPDVIFIITRPGSIMKQLLGEFFHHEWAEIVPLLRWEEIGAQYGGLSVSLLENSNTPWHAQIYHYPGNQPPDDVLHHPDEQKLITVQKIEQIIGLSNQTPNSLRRQKKLTIFNSGWVPSNAADTQVDVSNPLTQREMDFFEKDEPLTKVCSRIIGIVNAIMRKGLPMVVGSVQDLAIFVGRRFIAISGNECTPRTRAFFRQRTKHAFKRSEG